MEDRIHMSILGRLCAVAAKTSAGGESLWSGRNLTLKSRLIKVALLCSTVAVPNIASALCSESQIMYVEAKIYNNRHALNDIKYALEEIDGMTGGRNFILRKATTAQLSNRNRLLNDGTNSIYLDSFSRDTTFAEAHTRIGRNQSGKCVTEADIRINKKWWNNKWIRFGGRYDNFEPDGKLTKFGNFRLAIVHEFGHVIGLPHLDGWRNIMNSVPGSYNDIYANDKPTFDGRTRKYYVNGGPLLRGMKSAHGSYPTKSRALRTAEDGVTSFETRLMNSRVTSRTKDDNNNIVDLIHSDRDLELNLNISSFKEGLGRQLINIDVSLVPVNGGRSVSIGRTSAYLAAFEDLSKKVKIAKKVRGWIDPNKQYYLKLTLKESKAANRYASVTVRQHRLRFLPESKARQIMYNDRNPPCVDPDGDGWGWNGSHSCKMPASTQTQCIDTDGDGWGWDGKRSCRV